MDINSALKMEIFVGGAVSSAGTSALLYARETHVVNPLTDHNILPSTSGNLKAYYIHILFTSEFIPSLPGVLTQQAIILFTE